jgi:nucleoside-diphosphate-sugar epimerase
LIGTYNVFEAARRAGVQQVIFASSNHAVGTYESELAEEAKRPEHRIIDHLVPPRPDSLYGVSKVFGEALGRYYADHQGLRVICLRIGWITKTDAPQGKEFADPETSMWQSQRDFAQLVEKCLEAPQVYYDVFYGVSNNPHGIFDLEHARDVVGYVPQDSSAERNAD